MGRIHQLDAQTANMIAAGEVVERPMGVVKELIENAIDAGSTHITVAVEQGGIERLTVTDNGCGMDSEDAVNAFKRHATSKIKGQNDLWDIATLGFRGEALPSIASVSKLTLTTSDGSESTRVQISYGDMVSVEPYPVSQGTEITVEGLFYRTPARLKHLRTGSYENSLIQNVIMQFAFSHPEIAFTFISNGKESFRTTGSGDLQEVLYLAWGREPAENAIPVYFSDFDYKVTGMIVKPHVNRSSRNFMHIFLNGRMVKTYRLYKALQEGYEQFIVKDRMPMAVLSIEMDPHLIDVNVHPSKWEVRLSKENQLEYLIRDEIHNVLSGTLIAPKVTREVSQSVSIPLQMDTDLPLQKSFVSEKKPEPVPVKAVKEEQVVEIPEVEEKKPVVEEKMPMPKPVSTPVMVESMEAEYMTSAFPQMQVLAQYHTEWILCATDHGLAILDYKECMRRITFEQAQKQLSSDSVMMDLLVPYTLQVSDDLVKRIDEINSYSHQISITFEPFGKDMLLVRSIPSWMNELNAEQFLMDFLEDFRNDSLRRDFSKEKIAKELSGNIRISTKKLSMEEMNHLLDALSKCQNPFTSPSGKTTFVLLDDSDIRKEFVK